MHVGDNIRRLRKARRLSQGAVATMGGFDRPYISRVETGKQTPSLKFLRRLAQILELPMAEFFTYPVTAVGDGWLEENERERVYIDLPVLEMSTLGAQRERRVPDRTHDYKGLVGRIRVGGAAAEIEVPSPDVFAVRVPDNLAAPDACGGDVLIVDPAQAVSLGDLAVVEPVPGAPGEVRLVRAVGEGREFANNDPGSGAIIDPAHIWGRVIHKFKSFGSRVAA